MDITQYIKPELLVLIPVCLIVGLTVKHTEAVSNKYISLIFQFTVPVWALTGTGKLDVP